MAVGYWIGKLNRTGFRGAKKQETEKAELAPKNLPCLWSPFYLAQKVGKSLG